LIIVVLQPRSLLLGSSGLGSSEFARHYYRNHGCFLFLRVLRWFTSPGSPAYPMYSDTRDGCSHPPGFPIRTSPDHSLLAAPRSFSQLTTSFIAYLRQGIHTHALSSLTIKSTSHTGTHYFALYLCFQSMACATNQNCFCPSIFNCQRSRLPRQPANPTWFAYCRFLIWWAWVELNHRPHPYQGCALAI
jgi:hypothetical protein